MVQLQKISWRQIKSIVFLLISILSALILTSCSSYTIYSGFDFATGESISTKLYEDSKETAWTKRFPGNKSLYEKYQLHYSSPILFYFGGECYTWYGKINGCVDGYVPYYMFISILQQFNPPENEAQEMFEKCIEMYKQRTDNKKVSAYLTERFNHYHDPLIKEMLAPIILDCKKFNNEVTFRNNKTYLIDYLKRHRKEYPLNLDKELLNLIIETDTYTDFFLYEYMFNPTIDNAVKLGFSMSLQNDNPNFINTVFNELEKAKRLDNYLNIVIPPNLPSLPPPVRGDVPHLISQYTNETFKDLPRREAALQILTYPQYINEYLKNKYKTDSRNIKTP